MQTPRGIGNKRWATSYVQLVLKRNTSCARFLASAIWNSSTPSLAISFWGLLFEQYDKRFLTIQLLSGWDKRVLASQRTRGDGTWDIDTLHDVICRAALRMGVGILKSWALAPVSNRSSQSIFVITSIIILLLWYYIIIMYIIITVCNEPGSNWPHLW